MATPPSTPSQAPLTGVGVNVHPDRPAIRLRSPSEVDPDWMLRHESFVARAHQGNIDLYLEGDSITDMWSGNFPAHFAKHFGHWKTANFAISGDRTEHVIWRLQNGELEGVQAKAIMLLIGTNNLPSLQGVYSARTPEEVAKGVRVILDIFRQQQPQAKILLLGLPPRADRLQALPPAVPEDLNPKVQALNNLLAKFADGQHIHFLNLFDLFLDSRGAILPNTLPDKLHPGEPGYEIWAKAVTSLLTQWLGSPET